MDGKEVGFTVRLFRKGDLRRPRAGTDISSCGDTERKRGGTSRTPSRDS